MSSIQLIITIIAIASGAMITRFAPFVLFPEGRKRPEIIDSLGLLLPAAMMGLLVVYCLRNVSFSSYPHGLPELIAAAVVAALQLWKRSALLSIGAGTTVYMLLVQAVFV
ncbi:MAG: AzlD domain-containing protein [Oscillospiraceae bacterium]|nr:AzlD domain-containing protein [Oscillospiraceae bacterium]